MRDRDAGVRLVGAKWLHRQALAVKNRWSDEWLRDPATVEELLPVLSDADPLVVEEAVGAARGIADRYRRDDRLLAPAVSLLASARPQTRLRAAVIVSQFDPPLAAGHLLRLFGDPDKGVRAGVMSATLHACPNWPAEARQRVRVAALERLGDQVAEVRCQAADLLRDVGELEDVPALKACLAGVKGVNYRQSIREAMRELQDRRTKRCT